MISDIQYPISCLLLPNECKVSIPLGLLKATTPSPPFLLLHPEQNFTQKYQLNQDLMNYHDLRCYVQLGKISDLFPFWHLCSQCFFGISAPNAFFGPVLQNKVPLSFLSSFWLCAKEVCRKLKELDIH